MKPTGKGVKAHTKAWESAQGQGQKTRKSGSGMAGSPKKGGCGGKFTWAGNGQIDEAEMMVGSSFPADVHPRDPNYEHPSVASEY